MHALVVAALLLAPVRVVRAPDPRSPRAAVARAGAERAARKALPPAGKEEGELRVDGRKVRIRGVGYFPLPFGARPQDPVAPCVYARDLPLIAALGANTVRTYGEMGDAEAVFNSLL